MRKLNALAGAVGLLGMQPALAGEESAPVALQRPTWSVFVSFAPTYSNNALVSRSDRRRDVYAQPDVMLRLDGKLASDISYRLYGRSSFDAFNEENFANETFALLGGRLCDRPVEVTAVRADGSTIPVEFAITPVQIDGQPIFTGIRLDDVGLILQGAIPASLLALAVQGAFDLLERFVLPRVHVDGEARAVRQRF